MNTLTISEALKERLKTITQEHGYNTDLGFSINEGFAVQADLSKVSRPCLFYSWSQSNIGDAAGTGSDGQSRKHSRQWQVEVLAPNATPSGWWLQAEHDLVRALSTKVGQRPLGQPIQKVTVNSSQLHPLPNSPLAGLLLTFTLDYSETYKTL